VNAAPALQLSAITGGYGRSTVLHDVSMSVPAGAVAALLGPNGAGKTTLLRIAAGLLRARRGAVRAGGADLTHRRPHERARAGVCLIPQGRGVFPRLTVRENLRLQVPPWRRGAPVDPALEAFPVLAERLGQTAGSLSGGEQQMLALARCYLAKPSVVLIDELSMGLAPRLVDQLFAGLLQLAGDGIALVLVEQYVNRALQMADWVHLLERGHVAFSGRPSELEGHAVLRGYLGADPQGRKRCDSGP
jgi:branched-chain amino acid transport system ATP-binding protein